MGIDILDLADRLWRGDIEPEEGNPMAPRGVLVEVSPGVAFVSTLANVSAISTGEGLVLVDTGSAYAARDLHRRIRSWEAAPVHTAIFSHGHIDHVFGLGPFEDEAVSRGWTPPRVVAHEGVAARFERYRLTRGYNAAINMRQFNIPGGLTWPAGYRFPDETYRDRLSLSVGGARFDLTHARGETDDHTWTWVPEQRVLCPGDLFIWAVPNAGNPQKVQRYPLEWAAALRTMADLGAEVMLPGHGLPLLGAERIRRALTETADLLESLTHQTLALMNEGERLDAIIHSVRPPAHLLERPYLRALYDDPEFIVRTVWRLYGGWYDGNPAHLKPAPEAALAREVAILAGGDAVAGARRLAERARARAAEGDLRLAGNLAEMAALAAPEERLTHTVRAAVLEQRAEAEPSLMAKGIFLSAARESRSALEKSG